MGYKIIVDAMGGDHAPQAPILGALQALRKDPQLQIIFTGKEEVIRQVLEGQDYPQDRVEIRHTSEVIENEEHSPAEAIRDKKDSSMVVAMYMVKNGEAQGMVSAGNTGALLAGSTLLVGRIRGVQRPALSVALPTGKTPSLLLDVGANMDSKPSYLVQFAQMSSIYMKKEYGMESPKVGLLNVGVEPGKGNALSKEVFGLLSAEEGINFIGNVEAREVLDGRADIIVTDGFAGNILLKSIEGTAGYIIKLLKSEIYKTLKTKVGGMLLKPVFSVLKGKLDPSAVGGTPLLGINGAVIKAHGNSKETAFANAITQCGRFIDSGIIEEITNNIKK